MDDLKKQADPASQDKGEGQTPDKKPEGAKEEDSDAYKNQKQRAEIAEREANEAKAKVAELQKQLESKTDSKGEVSDEDLAAIAQKHDVEVDFVKDIFSLAQGSASKAAEKLVSDKLSEKDKEREKERILNTFKENFEKVGNGWEGVELSEQAVRMHYLEELANNPKHSVEDSIEAIYGSFKKGKATVEDDPTGADDSGEPIDFNKVSQDPEKLDKVLKDPKARKKYYDWRDAKGL